MSKPGPISLAGEATPACLSNLMLLRDKVVSASYQGSAAEFTALVDDLVHVSLFLRCRLNQDGGVTLAPAEVTRLLALVERARP